MESLLGPHLPLFERERAAGNALVLGVLVHTAGSTYRKPGALMLIAANGDYSGLLSGGCLEGDLRQHAITVMKTGEPRIVSYDLTGPDDLLWGLGLGCEGAMRILLLRVGPEEDWQPMTHLARCLATHTPTAVGIVVESESPDLPIGTIALPEGASALPRLSRLSPKARATLAGPAVQGALGAAAHDGRAGWTEEAAPFRWKLFTLPLSLPPKVLLLGAGPDAAPIVDFAAKMGWKVTLVDHRPAYADPAHFPAAERVVLARPEELRDAVDLKHFSAAVVMSHHLPSDSSYLRALAATTIPYVGLLGPVSRREKLLRDLGDGAQSLRARLHAPVGLALGGRSPESIALAIVAEIHAFVHGADGKPSDGTRATQP
ncbi:MAG TPA: XdhC family protein [Steroidobacteraceae bacterium]|nr:XdhC family protein [Steroidobacteraceae bacterium]